MCLSLSGMQDCRNGCLLRRIKKATLNAQELGTVVWKMCEKRYRVSFPTQSEEFCRLLGGSSRRRRLPLLGGRVPGVKSRFEE